MRLTGILALGALSALGFTDPAFHFDGEKCVNDMGVEGLNPGLVGDCGDLRGLDFSGKDLSFTSLRGADLSGAKFVDGTLVKVDFQSAHLVGADLNHAFLNLANLARADLTDAKLVRTSITDVNFTKSTLLRTDLSRSVGSAVIFTGTEFFGTVFRESKLLAPSFKNAVFAKADLSNAWMSAPTFNHAGISDTLFVSAFLVGADFTFTEVNSSSFTGAKLASSKFDDSKFYESDLNGADLKSVTALRGAFSYVSLGGADLTQSNFSNAIFLEGSLAKTTGTGTNFRTVKFSNTNLSESTLVSPDFLGAEFDGADLHGAKWSRGALQSMLLRNVNLTGTDLSGADLRVTRIEGCRLERADFTGSDLRLSRLQDTGWNDSKMIGAKINHATVHAFTDEDVKGLGISAIGKHSKTLGILSDLNFVQDANFLANVEKASGVEGAKKTDKIAVLGQFDSAFAEVGTYLMPRAKANIPVTGTSLLPFLSFLEEGGNLFFFQTSYGILNPIFNVKMGTAGINGVANLDAKVAETLGIKDLPTALTFPSNGTAFTLPTLPTGALVLYAQGQKAAIAVLPYAQGRVWFFAWPFAPINDAQATIAADWADVLKKSIAATFTE